jgi:hypothetical protein
VNTPSPTTPHTTGTGTDDRAISRRPRDRHEDLEQSKLPGKGTPPYPNTTSTSNGPKEPESMSYKSRQKKRAIRAAKEKHRAAISERHYLTLVKRKCVCNACGGLLRAGKEMVYRHTPREILCTICAEHRGLAGSKLRVSARWEKAAARRTANRKAQRRARRAREVASYESTTGTLDLAGLHAELDAGFDQAVSADA